MMDMRNCIDNQEFYGNHIQIGTPESWISSEHGRYTKWECFLHGEVVGEIIHNTHCATWEKPYGAECCYNEKLNNGHYRMRHIGWYDSLIAAKVAMLEPARKFFEEVRHEEQTAPVAFLPSGDYQFYPTPSELAGKLIAGVKWGHIKSILEPSAGRGDLLEYAITRGKKDRRKGGYFQRTIDDIDCVEIDTNLRAMLTGKGYRVVGDDFLDYYTWKHYDLILMNPPFYEGDEHLLHALELVRNGGQVACILNAETIRNPFTNRRKALLKELHRLDASIRFEKNAFAKADRKADVDVALINVFVPYEQKDGSIWDSLEKAQSANLESESMYEVAPADTVERLLREYDLMCAAGIKLMQVYNGVAPRILASSENKSWNSPIITLSVADNKCDKSCGPSDLNRYLECVRSRFWHELFDMPELRERMTSTMRDEYRRTISKMREYEFSRFNIQQVINQIMGSIVVGVEEAIVKCFDKLSAEHSYNASIENENVHYYNGWKTNKAHYVNMKCIIPTYGCFARGYKTDKYGRWKDTLEGIDVRGCFQALDDLEKALDYLDKGETTSTSLERSLQIAANNGRSGPIACKYFSVTFYKKGTCHIKFHDQKIVDRLNIFVGRNRAWLPPSYGKVRYQDMDAESRAVVDQFQGQEDYDRVMDDPKNYIVDIQSSQLLIG